MTSCVTFSWSRSSCKMTCLSWHSSKKSSECRLSCKAGKKVSWVQSTTSSLSPSPSFGVSSSATAGRGQVVWAWATLHHEGSVQPRPEALGGAAKSQSSHEWCGPQGVPRCFWKWTDPSDLTVRWSCLQVDLLQKLYLSPVALGSPVTIGRHLKIHLHESVKQFPRGSPEFAFSQLHFVTLFKKWPFPS